MPTYEYECRTCGHHFEVFQNMSDNPLKKCPESGGKLNRVIGAGIIMKGAASTPACGNSTTCCGKDIPCSVRPCDDG